MDQKLNEQPGSGHDRLEDIGKKLMQVEKEIAALRKELAELRQGRESLIDVETDAPNQVAERIPEVASVDSPVPVETHRAVMPSPPPGVTTHPDTEPLTEADRTESERHTSRSNLEKFIGENIIGKLELPYWLSEWVSA